MPSSPLIVCSILLAITIHVESTYISDYSYHPQAGGWIKIQKYPATWQQAFIQCHNEGAVLASPLTTELRKVMQLLIDNNDNSLSYFVGANSRFTPGHYVSIEGIPVQNMPVGDMYQLLDTELGECLTTDGYNITVASCAKRLPYLCFRKDDGRQLTDCGTFDKEYVHYSTTGSCYKVHRKLRTWLEANSMCITEGSYLAIINDEKEARLLTSMIPDVREPWITADRNWEPLYVGVKDWTNEGLWLTIHGGSLDEVFNSWHVNQPDAIKDQDCGAINRGGKFDNIWCHDKVSYFVCEKDPRHVRFSDAV